MAAKKVVKRKTTKKKMPKRKSVSKRKVAAKKASKRKTTTKKKSVSKRKVAAKKVSKQKTTTKKKSVSKRKVAAKKASKRKTTTKKKSVSQRKVAAKKNPKRKATKTKSVSASKRARAVKTKALPQKTIVKKASVRSTKSKVEPKVRPAPKVGAMAPQFVLLDDAGKNVSLSSFQGKKVVLYFYPRDQTPGCTVEAQKFRDAYAKLKRKGAIVLGVSRDSVASHERFRSKEKLPFSLLSDPDGEVISAYGSWGEKRFMGRQFMGILRTTVLIDRQGKVRKIYPKVSPKEHADQVLRDLDAID